MVKRLAQGWMPERDEEMQMKARADAKVRELANSISSDRGTSPKLMRHYFYFSVESQARKAAERLRSQGQSVEVRQALIKRIGSRWLPRLLRSVSRPEESADKMEAIASEFGGEYDGWEVAIDNSRNDSSDF